MKGYWNMPAHYIKPNNRPYVETDMTCVISVQGPISFLKAKILSGRLRLDIDPSLSCRIDLQSMSIQGYFPSEYRISSYTETYYSRTEFC